MKHETIETNLRMADLHSVPEFFATHVGLVESAGGGNMRIVRCVKRGGMLWPVYSLITPSANLITDALITRDRTLQIQSTLDAAYPH